MRLLKFRVWDKEMMRYSYDGWAEDTDVLVELWECIKSYGGIPMQFTGLHDKNGKEIYEGDIVKNIIDDNSPAYQGKSPKYYSHRIELIAFDRGRFISYRPKKNPQPLSNYTWGALLDVKDHYYEIIGNIYENPEILEEK